jgi:hypothetical protein
MSRLIIISNRVQAPSGEGGGGNQGGLAVALSAALREYSVRPPSSSPAISTSSAHTE